MRSPTRLVVALLSAGLLASLSVTSVAAGFPSATQTRYVDDDGMGTPGSSCDGPSGLSMSIQDTIDAANPGDTIMVCPGFYDEVISVTKNDLKIISVKKWKALIVPPTDFTPDSNLFSVSNASGVVVKHFKFWMFTEGECEYVASMVYVNDAPYTQIRGNKVVAAGDEGLGDCGYLTGIFVTGESDGTEVNRNRITDFQLTGILLDNIQGNYIVKYNRVNFYHAAYATAPYSPMGIYADTTPSNVQIVHNKVRSLDTAGTSTPRLVRAISVSGANVDVRGNSGKNVGTFIYLEDGESGRVNYNRAVSNVMAGLDVNQTGGLEVAHNVISGSNAGVDVNNFSFDNNFHDNDWTGASTTDCEDDSSGSGTADTGNTWTNNYGDSSIPVGICTPAP